MNLSNRQKGLVFGALSFLFTFLFFIFAIAYLLENPLYFKHILVFFVMGLITGGIFFLFTNFKLTFANIFFLLGNILGFVFIGLTFSPNDGWSNIGGLLGYFFLYGGGLVVGLVAQLIAFIVKKHKQKALSK